MPYAPMHVCNHPGCPALVPRGTRRCPPHAKAYDLRRGSAQARGYDSRWATFSRRWRDRFPLCGMRRDGQLHAEHSVCVQEGVVTPAQCVDHIFGHQDDPQRLRFYDEDRLQSLCLRCNNRKRATEEGGFGR